MAKEIDDHCKGIHDEKTSEAAEDDDCCATWIDWPEPVLVSNRRSHECSSLVKKVNADKDYDRLGITPLARLHRSCSHQFSSHQGYSDA